jgi:protein-S-isoprenylcysteine O-methyltransferase Ste14
MSELLDALGVFGRNARRLVAVTIWVGFGVAMIGIAAGQAYVEAAVGASTVAVTVVVMCVWAGWTVWHSYLFGEHRLSYLRAGLAFPYRRAFLRDIFPGITIGFSQMLRPAFNGVNVEAGRVFPHVAEHAGARMLQLIGVVVFAGAFALFATAWHTLGASKVGFVAEFRDPDQFEVVREGPYARVRHPLFWSGVAVSWSLALITLTWTAVAIAMVNTAYGLAYNLLEDRRFVLLFGDRYRPYSEEVPHIIPRSVIPRRRS